VRVAPFATITSFAAELLASQRARSGSVIVGKVSGGGIGALTSVPIEALSLLMPGPLGVTPTGSLSVSVIVALLPSDAEPAEALPSSRARCAITNSPETVTTPSARAYRPMRMSLPSIGPSTVPL
jgi:hypothetical protein